MVGIYIFKIKPVNNMTLELAKGGNDNFFWFHWKMVIFLPKNGEKSKKKWYIFEKKKIKKIVMAHFPLPFAGTTQKLL